MEPPQMADLLTPEVSQNRTVWPLSLLAFHASVHSVSLPNRPVTADTYLCERLLKHTKTFSSADIATVKPTQDIVGDSHYGSTMTKLREKSRKHRNETTRLPKDSSRTEIGLGSAVKTLRDGQWLQLDHCYRRHVKPKKQHEIMTLAPLLDALCRTCRCERVIDVGAGQGHLSRLLSFGYGLNVTTVEAAGCHAPKAAKFDGEVKDDIRKEKFHQRKEKLNSCEDPDDTDSSASPRHIIATIDHRDSVEDFLHKLQLHHLDASCETKGHEINGHGTNHETKGHEINGHGNNHHGTKGHETKHHGTNVHEINGHKTKGHESNHLGTNGHEMNGHKTKGHESNHHETKGHETNHHGTNGHVTKGHEINGHGTNHNETKGHETNHHGTNGYKTKGHETNHHGTNGHKTKGHETNHHGTNGHEINGHKTKGHESNHHETKGHETKHHGSNGHVTKGHETNHHETKGHGKSCHETNGHETNDHDTKWHGTKEHSHIRETKGHECNLNTKERETKQCETDLHNMTHQTTKGHKTDNRENNDIVTNGSETENGDAPVVVHRYCESQKQPVNCVKCDNTFMLVGLHVCGDLTPTMMQVFVKCREASALAVVSCCYMKLSSARDHESGGHVGYPMSTFTSQLANYELSYEALEGACHFNDAYHRKLIKNSPELVSHGYRAALQEIVAEKCPNMQHGSVRLTMRKAHHMTFKEYAEVGLRRLGLETDVTSAQLERAQLKLARWRDVVAFFTLRLCLLPVVETAILLDRMLFLAQNDINSCLVPIFDPGMSPRNFVLLASKVSSPWS